MCKEVVAHCSLQREYNEETCSALQGQLTKMCQYSTVALPGLGSVYEHWAPRSQYDPEPISSIASANVQYVWEETELCWEGREKALEG